MKSLEVKPKNLPKIVVIGGGTGTYTLLCGLREQPVEITAILTMVDDGGSNRVLRDEFGLLPTSGVRLAMVALSQQHSLLRELFMYRFHQGTGISGMTFGNLFLAAVSDVVGSQRVAIEKTCKLLGVKGKIVPSSWDDVRLVAKYADGHSVMGEHQIDEPRHDGTLRITSLATVPKAVISPEAKLAIEQSDLVVLGPGDFYTNTVANLVVSGMRQALAKTKGKVVFVMNLMTKYGEAYDYKASNYLKDLDRYLPYKHVDVVVINNDMRYPKNILEAYELEKCIPVVDDLDQMQLPKHISVIRTPLISRVKISPQKGDDVKRSILRHDSRTLASQIVKICKMPPLGSS